MIVGSSDHLWVLFNFEVNNVGEFICLRIVPLISKLLSNSIHIYQFLILFSQRNNNIYVQELLISVKIHQRKNFSLLYSHSASHNI